MKLKPFDNTLLRCKIEINDNNTDTTDNKLLRFKINYAEIFDDTNNILIYNNGISIPQINTNITINENCKWFSYKVDTFPSDQINTTISTINNNIPKEKYKYLSRLLEEDNNKDYELKQKLRKTKNCPQRTTKADYEEICRREGRIEIAKPNPDLIPGESFQSTNAGFSSASKKNYSLLRRSHDENLDTNLNNTSNNNNNEIDSDDNLSELSIHDIGECPSIIDYHVAKLNEMRSAISKRKFQPVISIIPIFQRTSNLESPLNLLQSTLPIHQKNISIESSHDLPQFNDTNSSYIKPESPIFGINKIKNFIPPVMPPVNKSQLLKLNDDSSLNKSYSSISNGPIRPSSTEQRTQKAINQVRQSHTRPSTMQNTRRVNDQNEKTPSPNKNALKVFEKFPGLDLDAQNSPAVNLFIQNESKIYTNTAFENLMKNYGKNYEYEMENFLKSQKEKTALSKRMNESPAKFQSKRSLPSSNELSLVSLHRNPSELSQNKPSNKPRIPLRSPYKAKIQLRINDTSKLPKIIPNINKIEENRAQLKKNNLDQKTIQAYQR